MAIQMILCMETNKKAATDYMYIRDTINRFYVINNQIKISPVYVDSKSRYQSKNVLKQIEKLQNDYIIGESKVIYCIDTDMYETNADQAREFHEIRQFCLMHNYDLVWFCHDVEEVYLGRRISDKQKVKEAGDFRKKNKIGNISKENLVCRDESIRVCASNILHVLDKYLQKK